MNKHRRIYFSIFIFSCFLLALLSPQNGTVRWLDAQMFRFSSYLLPVQPSTNKFRVIKLDDARLQTPQGIRDFRYLLRQLKKSSASEIVWLSDGFPQMDYMPLLEEESPRGKLTTNKTEDQNQIQEEKADEDEQKWEPTQGERNKLAWMLENQKIFLTQYNNSPQKNDDIDYQEFLQYQTGWRKFIPSIFLPEPKIFKLTNAQWPYRIYPFDSYATSKQSLIWYSEDYTVSLPDLSLAIFSQAQSIEKIDWDESGILRLGSAEIKLGKSAQVFSYFSQLTGRHTDIKPISLESAAKKSKSFYKNRIILIGQNTNQLQALADSLSSLELSATYHTPVENWWISPLILFAVVIYLIWLLPLLSKQSGLFLGAFLILGIISAQPVLLILKSIWWPTINTLLLMLVGQLAAYVFLSGKEILNSVLNRENNAWFQLGHYQYIKGDYETAIGSLLKCQRGFQFDGEVLDDLYEIGLSFERKRQYDRALNIYSEINIRNKNYKDVEKRLNSISGLSDSNTLISTPLQAQKTLVMPEIELPEFGRYKIERELGRGAMGVVYLGQDPKINRQVAIKTLDYTQFPTAELKSLKSRFLREAEAAGRLSHSNIVTVYDVGEEEGFAFIAMDYVNGEPLSNYTRADNLLPVDEVYKIIATVAKALDYAHSQKIVHRDIKPGNIMYDVNNKKLKITDFGIARITDSVKTRTGSFMGSPSYMAPEQMSGAHVDGRADIYALGVSFYQLLTGKLPFDADSLGNLAYKIANEKHKPIKELRGDLPASATRIVNKALQKNPEKRYANGADMASAIERGMPG